MAFTIYRQLIAVSLVVASLTAGSTFFAYREATNLARANERMNINAQALRNHMEGDMLHDTLRSDVLSARIDSRDDKGKDRQSILADLKDHGDRFKEILLENSKLPLEPKIQASLKEIRPLLDSYIDKASVLAATTYTDRKKAEGLQSGFDKAFSDMETAQADVSKLFVAENNLATKEAIGAANAAEGRTLFTGFLIILVSLPLSYLTGRRIARRLAKVSAAATQVRGDSVAKLQEAMNRLAEGDLTARFDVETEPLNDNSGDEIGELSRTVDMMTAEITHTLEAYDRARSGLSELVGSVSITIDALSSSSKGLSESMTMSLQSVEYIATGSEQLAQIATEGADVTARLSQSVASVAEGSSRQLRSVQDAAGTLANAQKTLDGAVASAASVADAANAGGQVVEQTERSMNEIQVQAQASAQKVAELDEQGRTIGSIVGTIEGIAEQTNLLALNAAIEAARAGEHGKGFAVVADEVRKLAEQSKLATHEIGDLIDKLRGTVAETVATIEAMNSGVRTGASQTTETGVALRNILTSVQDVADDIRKAAQASTLAKSQIESLAVDAEQSRALAIDMAAGAQSVLDAVNNVAAVSEETAAGAQEMNASSESISDSARALDRLASDLRENAGRFQVESVSRPALKIAA